MDATKQQQQQHQLQANIQKPSSPQSFVAIGGDKKPAARANYGPATDLLLAATATSNGPQQHQHQQQRDTMSSSSSNRRDSRENNRTTDVQTMMHILKANIGTGVLAMPNAFKNVGLWPGFVLVPLIGAICIHCMNILIASHNKLCDRFNFESLDYDQVASLSLACGPKFARRLAKGAHVFVTSFLIFTQLGFCCVYIMFVVENLQLAALNLFQIEYSTTTYLLLVFPVIGLTSCTSNLKHLARISTLANALQLTGLALIFFDLLQFHTYLSHVYESQSGEPLNSTSSAQDTQQQQQQQQQQPLVVVQSSAPEVSQWISPAIGAGLPLFFATAVYAFEGIGVVLPLIKEMEYPERISGLNGVLNTSMSMVAILYMAVGFFGYAKYGHWVQASITLNLPETMLNDLVRLIFALAIGLSYSLQFYVPWTIVWPCIDETLFYSYRPRVARDKLQILDKLSAANEWAISDLDSRQDLTDSDQQQQESSGKTAEPQQHPQLLEEQNSIASTFATSFSMSTCQQQSWRLKSSSLHHYGSFSASTRQQQPPQPQPAMGLTRRPRNRLADLAELSGECDSIPRVQWRPPPRSMRGQRKLVRYTVILLSVSFTCKYNKAAEEMPLLLLCPWKPSLRVSSLELSVRVN